MATFRVISPSVVQIGQHHIDVQRIPIKGLIVVHQNILSGFREDVKWKGLEPSLAILRQLSDLPVNSPREDIDLFRAHLLYFCREWHKSTVDLQNLNDIDRDVLGSTAADPGEVKATTKVYGVTDDHKVQVSIDGGVSIYPPIPSHQRTVKQLRRRLNEVVQRLEKCIEGDTDAERNKEVIDQLKREEKEYEPDEENVLGGWRW